MRRGTVIRVLRHGTVVVRDDISRATFPFYKAKPGEYRVLDAVKFSVDITTTIIEEMEGA